MSKEVLSIMGAQLIHAVAGSEVPHITLLVGNSFGAGNYAMCGRSFDPRFLFAYPNVKSGVMGAEQLAGVMEIVKINSALKQNKKIDKRQLNRDKKKLIISGSYLLFPFARSIISNITMEGGFKPLVIQPIEFENIFKK